MHKAAIDRVWPHCPVCGAFVLLVRSLTVAIAMMTACSKSQTFDPTCVKRIGDWCRQSWTQGATEDVEFGFRFAAPRDVDGDGIPDMAAGSRWTLTGINQDGAARVWSGASGKEIRRWKGYIRGGLLGHAVVLTPDLSGDGLADLVMAAPLGHLDGEARGVLWAGSPLTGESIWRMVGNVGETFAWDLALAGDQDLDGLEDIFVGAPGAAIGKVYLLSGADGHIIRSYAASTPGGAFGWYVSAISDMDGDGLRDLVIGEPYATVGDKRQVGAAHLVGSVSGTTLKTWSGTVTMAFFGEMVAGLSDLDGDGHPEVAVGVPFTPEESGARAGEVFVYSGHSGELLHHFEGRQVRELYGRMVTQVADFDGDLVPDIAVGAPWHRVGRKQRVGRLEIRSGRSGKLLTELVGTADRQWLGWHVVESPSNKGRPSLWVGSLRVGKGAGAVGLYVYSPIERSR